MDTSSLTIELNIALIPNLTLIKQLVNLSQKLADEYPSLVQLSVPIGRLAMAPHLTLYQVPLLLKDTEKAAEHLASLARQTSSFVLQATTYAYNEGEASFEVGYETTDALAELQKRVIDIVNPLRSELLLERDPAGNAMTDFLQKTDRQSDDVRNTGYWEVGDARKGGFFRPHATLNWFKLGTPIDLTSETLPQITRLNGQFDALGLYVLGPHGSCPQLLAKYPLLK